MNGLPNGNGTYIWRNGRTYKGEFSNGLRHGKGAQTWIDGSSYVGSWAHDQPDGWGSHYMGNGTYISIVYHVVCCDGLGTRNLGCFGFWK